MAYIYMNYKASSFNIYAIKVQKKNETERKREKMAANFPK